MWVVGTSYRLLLSEYRTSAEEFALQPRLPVGEQTGIRTSYKDKL